MNMFKFTLEGVDHDHFFLDIVRNIRKHLCIHMNFPLYDP